MKAAPLRAAAALGALLAASLALAGCTDILNALSDSAAPTGVSASDGDYANSIEVSWGTPNISSDKWAGKSIAGYDVSWDGGPLPRFAHVSGNSCSIHVDDAYRALSYEVTVKTVFQGGSSGGFASDSGFAISTQDLIWRDGGSNCSPAAAEQWYVTMLQKGFTYSFDFKTGSGVVEFYTYKTLDSLHSLTSPAHVQSWTCDEEGQGHKFYVRVASSPSSAPFTFVASYGF